MKLSIRSRRFQLTPSLERYAERRASAIVERFRDRVRSIELRMSDVNGPKGGIDKRCDVYIRGPHQLRVTIEERDSDMYAAIDRALARAKQALLREIGKRGELRDRRSIREPAPSMG